jgi:hypothetical protein
MLPQKPTRWYHLTSDRFVIGLLVVQVFLLLSARFQWFPFNEHKGWTVLIAVGVVGLAVLVMLVWGLVCLCWRRRFQFSFRSLLVFLLAVSVPLGWFAWELERARRQRKAVEAIVGMGGDVYYYDQYERVMTWETNRPPIIRLWLLKRLGRDFFIRIVKIDCTLSLQFGDDEAMLLKSLSTLEKLYLSDTQISDEGVKHLTALTKLRLLVLVDTHVSDESVKRLQQALPECQIDH